MVDLSQLDSGLIQKHPDNCPFIGAENSPKKAQFWRIDLLRPHTWDRRN